MSDSLEPLLHHSNTLAALEKVIAKSCDCKLREKCLDKSSTDCLKHRNLYAEAMQARKIKI
jgi:hypothetical protein